MQLLNIVDTNCFIYVYSTTLLYRYYTTTNVSMPLPVWLPLVQQTLPLQLLYHNLKKE